MIYFIIFILSFLFGILVKINGEVLKLEFSDYTVSIDLYFIIVACIVVLFLLIIIVNFFSHISSMFIDIKKKRKDKKELLILEFFFSIDLDGIENVEKLLKSLDEDNDKLLLVKIFNAGKTGNYSFFGNGITSIANTNCNLALLLSHKLIIYLKKDTIAFQKFIEYCSSSINNKALSLPFQIENFILKSDWYNAIIKLKEATRLNIFLPFNHKKMLATFYCALAREHEKNGGIKEAIKSVLKAQSCYITFRPINYLKAELYIKLAKVKKASEVLEAEYEINPTPQIARLYMSLNDKNTDQLCNLHPDYYFSHCMLALSAINSGKYDLADQCLNTAMAKANYLSIYLIMIQLQVSLQEKDKVIYWLNKINSKALSDPSWRCKSCDKELERWDCRCYHCGNFNCIVFSEKV